MNFLKAFLFLCLSLSFDIEAGGIALYEISTSNIRLASAGWSARANDPSTLFTNPAGMSRLPCKELQTSVIAIDAHVSFAPGSSTSIRGTSGDGDIWLPAGSAFYIQPINDDFTAGFGSLGYFGADLRYNGDWVGRYYVTHSLLEGFSAIPAAAYRLTDEVSIGLGANVMFSLFRQKSGIHNAVDQAKDGVLRLQDEDFGAGAIAGLLYEMSPCTRVGIQYLSPVKLQFRDRPRFQGLGPTLERLLRESGLLKSEVKINVVVPQSVMVGIYHDFNCFWSFMADVGWQEWSRFQKVSINLPSPTARSLTFLPKYQDTWHAALGAEYHYSSYLTFSGGMAYDSSAVTEKERTLDFPIGEQWRLGTGLLWAVLENLDLEVGYELQWTGNLPVHQNRGELSGNVVGTFKNTNLQFFTAALTLTF